MSRIATGVVAVAATVLATPSPASASAADHTWSESGVRVEVWEHDDVIQVTDTKGNRHNAGFNVYIGGTKRYTLYAMQDHSYSSRSAGYGGKYNLPEGKKISLSMWGGATVDKTVDHSWVNDH